MPPKKTQEEELPPKTVEVAADTLNALMNKIDELQQQGKLAKERMETLEALAGENAIKSFNEGRRDHTVKRAHLKVIDGQPVVSWGNMLSNKVYRLPNGQWKEDQRIRIRLLDDTEKTMDYADWVQGKDLKFYTIKRMSSIPESPNSPRVFTLADEKGDIIEVLETFVNP